MDEAKKEYNTLLKRYYKANEYFDRKDIPNQEKERFLDAFKEILKGLNYLLKKIEVYDEREILDGFQNKKEALV